MDGGGGGGGGRGWGILRRRGPKVANTASDAENKGETATEVRTEADAAIVPGAEVGTERETKRRAEGRLGGARETGNAAAVDCIVEEEEEDEDDEDGQ